jgi:hypothetical protein
VKPGPARREEKVARPEMAEPPARNGRAACQEWQSRLPGMADLPARNGRPACQEWQTRLPGMADRPTCPISLWRAQISSSSWSSWSARGRGASRSRAPFRGRRWTSPARRRTSPSPPRTVARTALIAAFAESAFPRAASTGFGARRALPFFAVRARVARATSSALVSDSGTRVSFPFRVTGTRSRSNAIGRGPERGPPAVASTYESAASSSVVPYLSSSAGVAYFATRTNLQAVRSFSWSTCSKNSPALPNPPIT